MTLNEMKFTELETYFPCTRLDFCQIVMNINLLTLKYVENMQTLNYVSMGWEGEGKANFNIKQSDINQRGLQNKTTVVNP